MRVASALVAEVGMASCYISCATAATREEQVKVIIEVHIVIFMHLHKLRIQLT